MKTKMQRMSGFTLVEIMIATTIAMILLFGALYSTSETLAVVREGDAAIHTNVHARRAMDRMLKDFRYSSALAVSGDSLTGWEITVTTTGTLDPGDLTYTWDPDTLVLDVSNDLDTETILTDLRVFNVVTASADLGSGPVITRFKMEWVLGIDAGQGAGNVAIDSERTFDLAGATWIRRNDA